MRTVLVTGGAGFIGSHLVEHLLESGTAVRVLDNLSTGSLGNLQAAAERRLRGAGISRGSRLEVIIGDIRDREVLRKALRGVRYVFHLAALPASAGSVTDSGEVHAVNVEGTLNILHGALTEGVWRVVLGSCASVYGTPEAIPVPEDAALQPRSLFAASKVAAETYARAFYIRHQLDVVVLRYFTVYGPRQTVDRADALVPHLVEALRERRASIQLDERSSADFIYVEDAVAATVAAARAPAVGGRAINIGSGQMVSVADLLAILSTLLQTSVPGSFRPDNDVAPPQIAAATTLAAELLEVVPRVSLVAGLARLIRTSAESERTATPALAPVGMDE
jgi:nucleoside-diphosphate-sugar epimerase